MKSPESITGILKILKKQEKSWQEKVKLVHKLLSNVSVFPNKHQILLDWASQELINHAMKGTSSGEMMEQLWQILAEVVKQSHLKKDQNFLTLRPGLIEAFIRAFSSEANYCMSLVECCTVIFKWNEICKPLTTKFEKFVILFANVLQCLTSKLNECMQADNDVEAQSKYIPEIVGLVAVLLQFFQKLQKQQSDPNQVFVLFCENSLHQIMIFKNVVSRLKERNQTDLLAEVEKLYMDIKFIFKKTILTRESLQCMKNTLDSPQDKAIISKENESKKKKKISCMESLITVIKHGLENQTEIVFISVLNFIPDLFQIHMDGNRKYSIMQNKHEFAFFRKMYDLVFDAMSYSSHQEACLYRSMKSVAGLVEVLLAYNVFRVNDDTVNNKDNYSCLQSIEDDCVRNLSSRSSDAKREAYRCLQYLIQIDHHLINPHIATILKELIKSTSDTQESLTSATLKEQLFNGILDIYGKSRQVGKFLEFLLHSVKTSASGESKIFLSTSSLKKLEQISSLLPTGQAVSLLQMLMEEMADIVKSLLDFLAETARSHLDCFGQEQRLEFVFSLYEIFATNAQIIPHGGHIGTNQEKYVNQLKFIDETVLKPLLVIHKELFTGTSLVDEICCLIWKVVIIFLKVQLFLLQHGLVRVPFEFSCKILKMPFGWYEGMLENYAVNLLKTSAVILYLKTSMLNENETAVMQSIAELKKSVEYCWKTAANNDKEITDDFEAYLKLITIELPWLGNLLDRETVLNLNKLLFMCYGSRKLDASSSSLKCAIDDEKPNYIASLLASAQFYDNFQMQDCFCEVVTNKLLDSIGSESASKTSTQIESLESLNRPETTHMESDTTGLNDGDGDVVMECADEDKCRNGSGSAEEQSLGPKLSVDEKERFGLLLKDFLALPLDSKSLRSSKSEDSGFYTNAVAYLEILKMLQCDWLIPRGKLKLLLANLVIQRGILFSLKKSSQKVVLLKSTLEVLSKVALSYVNNHTPSVIDSVDPASILHWLLLLLEKLEEQIKLPMDEISIAVRSLSKLIVMMKRPRENDETLEKLTKKILEICEKSLEGSSCLSISVINTLMSVIYETINSPAKKNAIITATTFVYPVMQSLLASNPFAERTTLDALAKDNGLLIIRSYSYVIGICISMKLSRKHARLVSMQEDFNWQKHFKVLVDLLKKIFEALSNDDISEELHFSAEEVCLDCLELLFSSGELEETSELGNSDFAEQMFLGLLNLAEKRFKRIEADQPVPQYYEIMTNILNRVSDENQGSLLNHVIEILETHLANSYCSVACLKFFDYLLGIKKGKEKQKNIRVILPKLIYICLEVLQQEENNENITSSLAAYNVIAKSLGISKGMVNNSHCIATLHLYSNQRKSAINGSFEVFIARVNLLSILLFNYADAVYPAISSFIIAVNSLLSDLMLLHENYRHITKASVELKDQDNMKVEFTRACEKLSRLYQEIGSHKQAITKYAPHFIASYLKAITTHSIAEEFQHYLTSGIYSIMDTCTENEFAMLNMHLAQGERELFKELHKEYTKHHKFQGKA